MWNILFLWAIGMWDRIAAIPYFVHQKNKWNKIYLLEYESWYFNRNLIENDWILKLLKDNKLYDWLFIIPKNKFKLLFFIIKNFHKFEFSYAPVKTFSVVLRWFLFSKKFKYTFKSLNDDSSFDNLVCWMNESEEILYNYSNDIDIAYTTDASNIFKLDWKYISVYPWPFGRSINIIEWKKIFDFVIDKWLKIVLVWWKSLDREGWIMSHLCNIKSDKIINLLWKTSFSDLCSILYNSEFIISANWWIMWLSCLVNKKVISFSTCSWKITHPSIDNINTFHLCPDDSIWCNRCELRISEQEFTKSWIRKCQFYWTMKEWICKKMVTAQKIITIIDEFYNV